MLDTKSLGTKIKELRTARGLTQSAFADELHISFQAVSNWERGIAPPELDNLMRIAAYFNVLIDDLLTSESDTLVLGIDGGGTKCEFAVATLDGTVLRSFKKSGCNPNDIGFDASFEIISQGIHDMLLEFPSIRAVFCGVSGIASGNYAARMLDALKSKYPTLKFKVQNDSANLFALDDESDMAVISGTGSVVFVKNGEEIIRIGGWGHLFDDAGSAYNIGRDGVVVALSEEDSFATPGIITKKLKEKLNVSTAWGAISSLYKEGKPFIASLAEVVFEAYREGDPQAIQIIDKNAKRLAEMLNLGVSIHKAKPRAIASGGIFEHYTDIMTDHISKHTEVELMICKLPPIYGACRQAHKLLSKDISENFYKNFEDSYKGDIK
ncbi:MAG: XRE family transcriptional regulator [Clostridia bacterium]|nr:XRE family transcriptional regulator [Clostridia bacterium]